MNHISHRNPIRIGSLCGALTVLLTPLLLSACGNVSVSFGKKDKGDIAKKEDPVVVIPVEAAYPIRGNISTYFETTTRVEAERRVDVASKGNARCIALMVEEGDLVKAGQILAELEKDEAQAAYDQTEVLTRQNLATYDRAKLQFDQGLGPKVELDNAQFTYEQSLATLESQRLQLVNLTIRAPIDGVVTARDIQQGMLVSSGTQVFSLMDPSSYMLVISPPEKELPRLKIGQKAEVTIDSLQGKRFGATIRRINPSVDPVSGTIKVVLDFDGDVGSQLRESAFARVKLVMATLKNVLLVPREAIVEEDGRRYVFVARPEPATADAKVADASDETAEDSGGEGGTLLTGEVEASVKDDSEGGASDESVKTYAAERVSVQTGLENSTHIQIYTGMTDGDLLITNGQHTLKTGAIVRVTEATADIWSKSDLSADEALAEAKEKREAGGTDDSSSVRAKRLGK